MCVDFAAKENNKDKYIIQGDLLCVIIQIANVKTALAHPALAPVLIAGAK